MSPAPLQVTERRSNRQNAHTKVVTRCCIEPTVRKGAG